MSVTRRRPLSISIQLSTTVLLAGLAVLCGCSGQPGASPSASDQRQDEVWIASLTPDLSVALPPGADTTLVADVGYHLASAQATISLLVRSDPSGQQSLSLNTPAVAISRGTGTVQVRDSFRVPTNGPIYVTVCMVPSVKAVTRQYSVGEHTRPGHARAHANVDQRAALKRLALAYKNAVDQESLTNLRDLVHPDLLAAMTPDQVAPFDALFLGACLGHDIPDDYTLAYNSLDAKDQNRLEDQWNGKWPVRPEMEIAIEFDISHDRQKTLSVYAARNGDEWGIVFPVPGQAMVDAYLKKTRRE